MVYDSKNRIQEHLSDFLNDIRSARVGVVDGIVFAIRIEIIAQYIRCLRKNGGIIRIDKPTDDGVVVTALQVIETGFGIVVIAAIAEGIDFADVIAGLAPGDIAVAPRIEVYSFLPVVSRVGDHPFGGSCFSA